MSTPEADIVERLRLQGQARLCPACLEAADYIERLRADRKQMSDTDIVSRMRIEADQWHPSEKSPIRELREGAAEIDRLRAGRAAVVEALQEICDELQQANGGKGPTLPLSIHILEIATRALKGGAA